jgi:hypothetical protein
MFEQITHEDVERIDRIHEDLKRFLLRKHPRAPALAVLVALSYEIGRCAGMMSEGMTDPEVESMLRGVLGIMRRHVEAFRSGKLRE